MKLLDDLPILKHKPGERNTQRGRLQPELAQLMPRKSIFFLVIFCCFVITQTACQQGSMLPLPKSESALSEIQSPPFAVGSMTVFVHDESRPFDAVGGIDEGIRSLVTEIWYPVSYDSIRRNSVRATYSDYAFGNFSAHHRMLTQTHFYHLDAAWMRAGVTEDQMRTASEELFVRARGSYIDLPPARAVTPFPVVVMSHGDGGSRYSMETVCEYLAAHGYIVVAPEHTGNSPYAMIGMDPALNPDNGDADFRYRMAAVLPLLDEHGSYGLALQQGQSYSPLGSDMDAPGLVQLDLSLVERVNDLRAVLKHLDEMDLDGPFAGRIDRSNIGLMGRSFGGATTLAGLMLENRFIAGFAVVPPALPDSRAQFPQAMLVSAPRESAILAADLSVSPTSLYKPTMLLTGAEDDLILGLGYQMATATGGTVPTSENPYPLLRKAFDNATVPAIMSTMQNTNHGSLGVAAPYWWPALKPNQFSKFFDNSKQYKLLDANIAHAIQQEMALAFFQVTLKGQAQYLDLLRQNPWQKYGASVDIRGF